MLIAAIPPLVVSIYCFGLLFVVLASLGQGLGVTLASRSAGRCVPTRRRLCSC